MRTVILCEGTTDLLMIQFVLQYKYGWKYDDYLDDAETNRLIKKKLIKQNEIVEIQSCSGINNIPRELAKIKDMISFVIREQECIDNVIVLIDHDTISSNEDFIYQVNNELETSFNVKDINSFIVWKIENIIGGDVNVNLLIKCIPENATGAIESVLLEALDTDAVENYVIKNIDQFINNMAKGQNRYLQKNSYIPKAIFNTYFAIRTPEESHKERSRVLKAYDWKNNVVLNQCFDFLNI